MSSDLTELSHVVLALVGRTGAGPHDLADMARRGQRLHYAGAASKMYAEPKRLERLGYLQSEKQPGRTRERTHYTLTAKGLAALQDWLGTPAAFPRIKNAAAARVLASDLADDPQVVVESLSALRQEIEELERILDEGERPCRISPAPRAPTQAHSFSRKEAADSAPRVDRRGRTRARAALIDPSEVARCRSYGIAGAVPGWGYGVPQGGDPRSLLRGR